MLGFGMAARHVYKVGSMEVRGRISDARFKRQRSKEKSHISLRSHRKVQEAHRVSLYGSRHARYTHQLTLTAMASPSSSSKRHSDPAGMSIIGRSLLMMKPADSTAEVRDGLRSAVHTTVSRLPSSEEDGQQQGVMGVAEWFAGRVAMRCRDGDWPGRCRLTATHKTAACPPCTHISYDRSCQATLGAQKSSSRLYQLAGAQYHTTPFPWLRRPTVPHSGGRMALLATKRLSLFTHE